MEKVNKAAKDSPELTANILSKVFFCWIGPLMRIGYKRRLEEDDVYHVLPDLKCATAGEELQSLWDDEQQKANTELRPPSLGKTLIRHYWKRFLLLGIFSVVEEIIKLGQPFLLGQLIAYFENFDPDDQAALHDAIGYGCGICLFSFLLAVIHHYYFYFLQAAGMKIRVSLCHMIYKKALLLSNSAMRGTTTGQIVNLISNDVNKFDEMAIFLNFLWISPLEALCVVVLLWLQVGPSCLAGIVVIIVVLSGQALSGKLFTKYRLLAAGFGDSRIRIMNEVVAGMRIIKMYTWEKPFAAMVSEVRRKEIAAIMKSSYLRSANMASFFCINKIVLFATFATYTLLGNPLRASTVFVTMSLFTAARLTITLFFPAAVEKCFEARVSISRIQAYLLLGGEEDAPPAALPPPEEETGGKGSVEAQDLMCYWDKSLEAPTLQTVSFSLGSNQLLAVIGPVGAGKSSLLSAILGELAVEKGTLETSGKLTYASQQAWVFPGTVRSNILFGKELHQQKYEGVLKACALKRDLELFPEGDMTVIGDRGATLSGGQKARINLARAVYQDADVYLLDDPLSAVDAEVGRHLFEQCICGLLKNKVRILVTHQLQYLKSADEILVLKEGFMVAKGTYTELQQSGIDFTSLLAEEEEDQQTASQEAHKRRRALSQISNLSRTSSMHSIKDADHLPADHVQTMADETRSEGTISYKYYLRYISAGASWVFVIFVFILCVLAQVTDILQDSWLAYWADEQEKLTANNTMSTNGSMSTNSTMPPEELNLRFYLGVYGGLTLAVVILGISRFVTMFHILVKSSQSLHGDMFRAILRAPVHFFDSNPVGRILNRFSKDMDLVDCTMPWTMVDFSHMFLRILGVIALVISVLPIMVVPVVPLLIGFLYFRRYFLQTSRDVKRLEATTRSPVYSHLSSSLTGLCTIRAFKAGPRFQESFDAHQDLHSEAWYLFIITSRWFAIRLDSLCALFNVFTVGACLLMRNQMEAGLVGLVLTHSMTLIGMFQWGIRQSTEMENLMTSVERIIEYTELESEAPWETDKRPPPDWPKKGMVTFDQVSLSYTPEGPTVLHDLKIMFRPKEKVGIVGRTGAGKSSLISALFRLSEPEGKIYIDGVLTSEIGLHDLRQKMSIIPQDPVLFTGSMRKNLDPFNNHADEELWDALEQVQLKPVVEELPLKLETILAESGSNFSVGQRQLVCLARALLRRNRILVIDEATANVDPSTDELIQHTIRDKFRECTVLTIAHRLNTIIDSDRILVLDAGQVHAYDEPYTLLQDTNGILSKMVQQLGKQEGAALLEAAKVAFNNNKKTMYSITPNGHKDNLVIFETAM